MPSCEKFGRTIAPHKILSKIDGVAWCTGREFFIEDFPRNRAVTLSIDLDTNLNIHDLQKGQHSKTHAIAKNIARKGIPGASAALGNNR